MSNLSQIQIDNLKKNYLARLTDLRSERDRLLPNFSPDILLNLTHRHKELVSEIVSALIEPNLVTFNNYPVGIFWNGSFSRNSHRLSSDYDLNFVYPEVLRAKIYPVENKICSLLAEIVGKPRDYVHAAVICHGHLLKDPGNMQGLEKLMFTVQWSSREPEQLKEYLTKFITPDLCYDWTSTYEIVYGSDLLLPIISSVEKYEIDLAKTPEFSNGFPQLISSQKVIIRNLLNFSQNNLEEVKNIKEFYKHLPFTQIFTVLALIRRKLLINNVNIGPIKIDNYACNQSIRTLLGPELSETFFQAIFHYIWVIVRIEAIFEKESIRFGVHSQESISLAFHQKYQTLCPDVGVDFHSYHRDQLKQLSIVLEAVLSQL